MQNSTRDTSLRYRERLLPSPAFFIALTLAGPMVALSFLPVDPVLGVLIGIAATLACLALGFALSPVVSIRGSVLTAGRAHIDVGWLGEASEHRGEEAVRLRRSELDTRGWHLIRGGIDGIVLMANLDPADPVTTWTISSRTPDRLAAAINAVRAQQG